MITRLLIVVVAGLAVWVLAVAGSMPVAPLPPERAPTVGSNKSDRLPLPVPASPPLTLADRLPLAMAMKMSAPEPVVPLTVQMPPELEPVMDQAVEPRRHRRHANRSEGTGSDICRGKGRSYTRGGRSWRCNR